MRTAQNHDFGGHSRSDCLCLRRYGLACSGSWPRAVLLHGMQGTGKSTAKVMLREKMGDFFDPMNYIIVNASDDRGLDYIRNQLKQMSAVRL